MNEKFMNIEDLKKAIVEKGIQVKGKNGDYIINVNEDELNGIFELAEKEIEEICFSFEDLTIKHGEKKVLRILHELDFERMINEKRSVLEYLSLQNKRKLTEKERKDFYEGLDHLKKRLINEK